MAIKDRLKSLAITPFLMVFLWISWGMAAEFFESIKLLENKIVVDGAITTASVFACSLIPLPAVIVGTLSTIFGINPRWVPYVFYKVWLGIVIAAFTAGWFGTYMLRDNLLDAGYVECKKERKLSSRYSSRTYVINPNLCKAR